MTPKERAAMQQALDALVTKGEHHTRVYEAITALRAALAGVNMSPTEQTEQTNTQLMEGYRIGLAEMREKCAKVCEGIEQDRWNLYKGRPPYTGSESGRADPHEQGVSMGAGECVAAIRAIKFEGDTGFRPVSEMIAEHKQDPKKGAAIEKAKMRKATRAEKIAMSGVYEVPVEQVEQEPVAWAHPSGGHLSARYMKEFATGLEKETHTIPLYAAPVRTKDLTDYEMEDLCRKYARFELIREAIAADREKNK